ncbi:MAG: tetratricopeptide repeat protein [Ardenticatenaceae bacterium]|nr:tetratricopeptide repeat protein [Anaerolineales bacterium]MCB8922035.1 tetratricopeptide repeat protein [Ardenticatenaceae bacterium]MCB8989611.1 tetratricopeptide repeat protein [Ardenticatenaceae bacterium]MCB9003154.1 tetratricopeptide repeat protein [Ardenticatenaceae bacterium]
MKKISLFAVLFVVLLAACGGKEKVAGATAVPTPTQPPATTTLTPAWTPMPTAVATETAVPTPTITPPSPPVDILDLSMLSAVSVDETITYGLKTPSYEFVRDWLYAEREVPDRSVLLFYFLPFLSFDFTHSFPNGAGDLSIVVHGILDHGEGYYQSEEIWPLLETAVIARLNENNISFEDGKRINISLVTLNPKAVDLNEDGSNEWLVEVEAGALDILGVIPLMVDSSGQYAILPNTIIPVNTWQYDDIAQVDFDYDFTGDGHVEILQAMQGYFLGGTHGSINVYTWNGSGFYALDEIDMTVAKFKPVPVFEVADFTGDGIVDIQVTTPHEVNFDCAWNEVDIYSWQDGTPQFSLSPSNETPETPECAMFHAITPSSWYSDKVLAEKSRVELLEFALNQLSLETAPSADYLALGYFHLAMAYLEQNDVTGARQAFNELSNLPDEVTFALLVRNLYAENGGDLLDVCWQLYQLPELAEQTGIRDYIYAGSVTGYFGPGSENINRNAICPFPQVVQERLAALTLPLSQHPKDSLAQHGFDFLDYGTVNIDDDPEEEWFGLVEQGDVYLTLLDQIDGGLKPIIFTTACFECKEGFEYEIRNDNGQFYIIGRLSQEDQCTGGSMPIVSHPFLVQFENEQFGFDILLSYCDVGSVDKRPLTEITKADFATRPTNSPTWRRILLQATGHLSEWGLVAEIQTAVLTQSDPDIPEKIANLLTYLPADDAEVQPYIQHLTYLLGYYYELSGEEETAVATYLTLIHQYPTSPWAWLAWARLEPVAAP